MLNNKAKYICSKIRQTISLVLLMFFYTHNIYAADIKSEQNQNQADLYISLTSNTDYEIENKDGWLYLTFSQPLLEDLSSIQSKLNLFVSEQKISKDKKTIELKIKQPHTIRSIKENNILHIQILAQDEKNEVSKNNSNKIFIDYGEHPDFVRYSFAYHNKPHYSIKINVVFL